MEQLTITLNNMQDVKREIDNCQRKAMTSVVELGYILRKADDAGLYKQEGYSSIFKFAEHEYGWDQSQTSRFMDINREFSEGGYSTVLQSRYEGYGQAKLSEMLTLPESIREELTPDMKREDAFAAAVMMEPTENEYLYDSIEQLLALPSVGGKIEKLWPFMERLEKGESIRDEDVQMVVSSTGFGSCRAGKVMYFWKKEGFTIVKMNDKKMYTYKNLVEAINSILSPLGLTPDEWYQKVYARDIPGKTTPAPEPPKKEEKKTEVAPAHKEEEKESVEKAQNNETSLLETESEELPGQSEIGEFAEKMPIEYENDEKSPVLEQTEPKKEEKKTAEAEETEVPQSVETSLLETELATQPEKEDQGQQSGECQCCSGNRPLISNDGTFVIHLQKNGTARIERGIYHAIIEFDHCPKCGKELIVDER